MAAELGIPKSYGGYQEILDDPDIEAVYIPLPNHLHAPGTLRAAAAGKHVLCEKPLAMSSVEAQEMVDGCQAAGVAPHGGVHVPAASAVGSGCGSSCGTVRWASWRRSRPSSPTATSILPTSAT